MSELAAFAMMLISAPAKRVEESVSTTTAHEREYIQIRAERVQAETMALMERDSCRPQSF